MSLYRVKKYRLIFRRISEDWQVDIAVQKMRISAVLQKIGIPVTIVHYRGSEE